MKRIILATMILAAMVPLRMKAQTTIQLANLANPISNGQAVTTNDVLWAQYTTQGIGTVSMHNSARIIPAAGQSLIGLPAACTSTGVTTGGGIITCTWDVATCALAVTGGFGTGIAVPVNGWLQSFTSYLNTSGFSQGSIYINHYALVAMPAGGGTASCVSSLAPSNIGTLLSGAPSGSFYPVSYPWSGIVSPWTIPGFSVTATIGNPAAGAEIGPFTTATGARTCINTVSFTFTTSATVANRTVAFRMFQGGGGPVVYWIATIDQPASTAVFYSFSQGVSAIQKTLPGPLIVQTVPFANGPELCSTANQIWTLSTLTGNIQAGDQYSTINIGTKIQQDNN